MFKFIYYNGLRPRECYNAKLNFLNLKEQTFYIPAISNKQRNQDTIPLPRKIIPDLKIYLKIRKSVFPNSSYLFPSTTNSEKPLYRGTFMRNFKKSVEDAGLLRTSYVDMRGAERKNISLYSLRHSFATICYLKTKDIRKTARMLRHYDFWCRSTLVYIHTSENMNKREILNQIFKNSYNSPTNSLQTSAVVFKPS